MRDPNEEEQSDKNYIYMEPEEMLSGETMENAAPSEREMGYDPIDDRGSAAAESLSGPGDVYEWVESCVFAIMVILLIFTFLVRSATVSGSSMVPTLHNGERLVLQQVGYNDPQYGDIIVVDRTQNEEPPIIKRVIGKEGDVIYIDFETGDVWRNDELLEEPYINELTYTSHDVEFPVRVPAGCLFVMGDNRNASADSRVGSIGMIDLRRVMGKAIFRFMPINKIGVVS